MKRILAFTLALVIALGLLSGCGGKGEQSAQGPGGDLYAQVMQRFHGPLEKGAVIKAGK